MSDGDTCCGFCLEPLNLSDEVRELPCCHQFCTECLVKALKKSGGLVCPYCRSNLGIVNIEDLKIVLATDITTGIMLDCGCRGCGNKARAFCKACEKLFCGKDLEDHDRLLEHGAPLSIATYKALQQKYGRKSCPRHRKGINLACAQCYDVFCDDCLDETARCRKANRQSCKHDARGLSKFSDSLLLKLETRMTEVKVHNLRIDDFIKLAQKKADEEEDSARELLEEFRHRKTKYIEDFKTYLENMDQRIVERMDTLRNERAQYEYDRTREKDDATRRLEACGRVITQHITDIVSSYEHNESEMKAYANGHITPFTLKKSKLKDTVATATSFSGPELKITPTEISPP